MNEIKPKSKDKIRIYKALKYHDKDVNYTYHEYLDKDTKEIIKTRSKNSLSFFDSENKSNNEIKKKSYERIKKLFLNETNNDIDKNYNDAAGGQGSEYKRICVLHSSSLCAFLHFCRVSDNLRIEIDEDKENKGSVIYNKVYFEVKNKVYDNPSSVDLVLISEDKKKILFLEAKFSEYLFMEKSLRIEEKYEEDYERLNVSSSCKNKLFFTHQICEKKYKDNKNMRIWTSDNKKHYLNGFKQIISHYIGVCNYVKGIVIDKRLKEDFDEIELATILFDGWEDKSELEDYRKKYAELAGILNNNIKNDPELDGKLHVRENVLTYQEVFDKYNNKNLLNEKIMDFYRYNK